MSLDISIFLAALLAGVSVGSLGYLISAKLSEINLAKQTYKVRVPITFKLLLPIARHLAPKIRKNSSFKGWLEVADQRLIMAGLNQMYTPEEFAGLRICNCVLFTLIGTFCLFTGVQAIVWIGALFLVLAWIYPNVWLSGIIRTRHRSIQRSLPNILDLLTLSVEAGRDFLTALRDILRNRESDALSEEFEQVFREVQLGKQRRHALRAMAERVRQPDIDTVVETLVQADTLGVSIGHILRILGEQMRQKRFSYAEKLANEAPTKLLLPLLIFIFPAVMIIMLAPILFKTLGHHL